METVSQVQGSVPSVVIASDLLALKQEAKGTARHSKAQQETARHSRSDAGLAIWALLFVALQDAYDLRELLQTSLDAGGLAIPFRLEPVVAEPLAVEGLAALERGHTCLKGY